MQVMIFVKSTQRANMLGGLLKDARFPCEVLHGGMKMPERQAIMKKFKESPNEVRAGCSSFVDLNLPFFVPSAALCIVAVIQAGLAWLKLTTRHVNETRTLEHRRHRTLRDLLCDLR